MQALTLEVAMEVCYKSYMEFLTKADLLTRELALTPKEAAELLAKVSGYRDHSTMPVGRAPDGPAPSQQDLILQLVYLRPDVCPKRAGDIITRLDLPTAAFTPEIPCKATPTHFAHTAGRETV
jgi:hypothetical protein